MSGFVLKNVLRYFTQSLKREIPILVDFVENKIEDPRYRTKSKFLKISGQAFRLPQPT